MGRRAGGRPHDDGHRDGGDWQTLMQIIDTDVTEYHEYSVRWQAEDRVFRIDGA